jgi:hypothetical protein
MTNELAQTVAQSAPTNLNLWSAWIQLGFAGVVLILLAIGCWLGAKLGKVLWSLNTSVTQNTAVTQALAQNILTLTQTVLQQRDPRDYADTQRLRIITPTATTAG